MPRPTPNFQGFIGQRELIHYVGKLVAGFRQLGRPLPPLLCLAPAGYGKTAFAEALAAALGTSLHSVYAHETLHPQDLFAELRKVNFGDAYFVDEAHMLSRDCQHALFSAVDKNKIPVQGEKGRIGPAMESVAEFTLVLATNYPGQVRKALRSRTVQLQFKPYSIADLKAIAQQVAQREGMQLTPQAARRIAEVAQGTPRRVIQRVKTRKLFAPNVAKYTVAVVCEFLQCEGLNRLGLTTIQQCYLRTLAAMPRKQSVLEHLAVGLGLDARFIREEIEYYLVEKGYIEVRSNNVRRLTQIGNELVQSIEL